MKKIIAAAVATAFVAPAMAADITISGDVEYKFTTQSSVTSGSTGDADFFITATEELANGVSVKAYVGYDTDTGTAAVADRESKIELSGSFGKIEIGNDAGEAIGEYDEVADVAAAGAGNTLVDNHSQKNSVVWHIPTGVEGLNAAVSYGAGTASANTTATSYAIQYTFSGVTAAYGVIDTEDQAYNPNVLSLSTTFGPMYVGYERIKNQAEDNAEADLAEGDTLTNIGVTYNYGMGKLFLESNKYEDVDATTLDTEIVAYGATYNLGSTVNFYVAVEDEKTDGTEEDTTTIVGVTYAF